MNDPHAIASLTDLQATPELQIATLRAQLEEAREALRKHQALLSVASHDLRNPLSSITMRSELLLQTLATPGTNIKPEIEAIIRSCQRMKAVLRGLSESASSSKP